MKVRTLLVATALLSTIAGAVVAYLVLTVPNDLQAAALLKEARKDLAAGKTDGAHTSLTRIVQQYPRTDAAAAANVALAKIASDENRKLRVEINTLKQNSRRQTQAINDLRKVVEQIRATPPRTVIVQPPAPKKPPPKKPEPKRRPTRRARRR